MKFDATDIEGRRVRAKSKLRSNQRSGTGTSPGIGTSTTPWEERIAQAKELTSARRADEDVKAFAARANAAYLDWLEQRKSRIEELRARIEMGTYRVDSATLAKDMLRKGTL